MGVIRKCLLSSVRLKFFNLVGRVQQKAIFSIIYTTLASLPFPPAGLQLKSEMFCKYCEDFDYDLLVSSNGFPHHQSLAGF
jgi:hypothetical protein